MSPVVTFYLVMGVSLLVVVALYRRSGNRRHPQLPPKPPQDESPESPKRWHRDDFDDAL